MIVDERIEWMMDQMNETNDEMNEMNEMNANMLQNIIGEKVKFSLEKLTKSNHLYTQHSSNAMVHFVLMCTILFSD